MHQLVVTLFYLAAQLHFLLLQELQENEVDKFKRVCLLFDSKNEVELTNARETWKSLSDAGVNTVYWAEDQGIWKKK